MQYHISKPSMNLRWLFSVLGVGLVVIVLKVHQNSSGDFTRLQVSSSKDWSDEISKGTAIIPNVVHFVHLVEESQDHPAVEFPFRQFIAIYSAWYHLKPEAIYIHTNIEEHRIEDAVKRASSPYTQAAMKLRGLNFRHHDAPNRTTKGFNVDKLPNQSDFVRTDVLEKSGGIYLDDDSYVLRDLQALRKAGFQNIVGRQHNGQICPAVILSTANNKMITAYRSLQDIVFDGYWDTHATDLLSTLVQEYQIPENQVLTLPQESFFPLSWETQALETIYKVHKDTDAPEPVNNKDSQDLDQFIQHFELHEPGTWKKDWRLSYVLHGWTSGIGMNFDEAAHKELFGQYDDITLEYVLAQNSNFARAVYPAMKHAVDSSVLGPVKSG